MNVLFADAFANAQAYFPYWDDGTRLTVQWYPLYSCNARFQNFAFRYGSYYYICADFVTRAHDLGTFNGAAADGELHNMSGGTWPWLQQQIANYPEKGQDNIIIFAHHPLSKDSLSGSFASFSFDEYDVLTQYLKDYSSCLGAWIAGHKHNVDEYAIKTWTFSPEIAMGYEAAANWEFPNGHFRIFRMWDTVAPEPLQVEESEPGTVRVFPNPCADQLYIQAPSSATQQIALLDISGREVVNVIFDQGSTMACIDTRTLAPGMYFLKMSDQPGQVYKIIKR
jgi:hypothetical protein